MSQIFLKPKIVDTSAGKKVLPVVDPETGKPLPDEGAWVTPSPYWRRRLLTDEVEQVTKAEMKKTTGKKGE